MEQITFAPTFTAWQQAARRALHAGIEPGAIHWQELDDTQPALGMFERQVDEPAPAKLATEHRVPRAFVDIARRVACHRDLQRWALLYRILFRLTHGEGHLLHIAVDPDIHLLTQMDRAIRRDVHKMHAFVRFRTVTADDGGTWYVAWFEPEHHIVEMNAAFFTDRFASMRWSILTPDRCAHWDGSTVQFTPGLTRADAPDEDAIEPLWRQYYANIFNPARVKVHAMQKEMPKRYWKNLPEAELIPGLLRQAPSRVETMIARSQHSARPSISPETSWGMLCQNRPRLKPVSCGARTWGFSANNDQVHVITSGLFTLPPFQALLDAFGIERVMFSVDYPFSSNQAGRAFLDELSLSESDQEKPTHGNVDRLLKLHA